MTVREHLNIKLWRAHLAGVLPLTLVVIVPLAYAPLFELAVPVLLLTVIASGVFAARAVRCPRCNSPIGGLARLPKGGGTRLSGALQFCPFCRLSLDTELRNAHREQSAADAGK